MIMIIRGYFTNQREGDGVGVRQVLIHGWLSSISLTRQYYHGEVPEIRKDWRRHIWCGIQGERPNHRCALIHSFTCSSIHLLSRLLTHSLTHPFTCSLTYSPAPLPTHSLAYSSIHSLTHSLAYLCIHLLSHLLPYLQNVQEKL